jgi:hypothetical protein
VLWPDELIRALAMGLWLAFAGCCIWATVSGRRIRLFGLPLQSVEEGWKVRLGGLASLPFLALLGAEAFTTHRPNGLAILLGFGIVAACTVILARRRWQAGETRAAR